MVVAVRLVESGVGSHNEVLAFVVDIQSLGACGGLVGTFPKFEI